MAGDTHAVVISFRDGQLKAVSCECGITIQLAPGETVKDGWQRHNMALLNERFNATMRRQRA